MKFALSILALPLAAIASPFVLEKRADNAAAIQKNLTQTNTDVLALNKSVGALSTTAKPTGAQVVSLQAQANTIEKDLNNTIALAKASSATTSSETTTTYNYVKNTLYPNTVSLLNNFIAHYPGFSSGGTYTKLVHDTLVREQGLVTSLGNALVAIATGPDAANAKTLATQFTNAFNPAITKYSS